MTPRLLYCYSFLLLEEQRQSLDLRQFGRLRDSTREFKSKQKISAHPLQTYGCLSISPRVICDGTCVSKINKFKSNEND